MILSSIEKFKHAKSITINNKSLSFFELIKKTKFFCGKIKQIKNYNKKLYALNIDDGLNLIITYLACIELKLSFFSLGQYYNRSEKEYLIKSMQLILIMINLIVLFLSLVSLQSLIIQIVKLLVSICTGIKMGDQSH